MNDWASEDFETDEAADLTDEAPSEEEPAEQEPSLVFGSTDDFFRNYLRDMYRRGINHRSHKWAADWWKYPEAITRIEALWRSWEHLRQDPATGMSVWLRDHADHHMAVLLSPEGPFAGVEETAENRSKKGEPLPYIPPPEGLFPDERLNEEEEA